ncbi:hypothetical protein QAD02_015195 [Eretmocerus hayati]|uniref:Uncharacterized protein n=1 Tax=Eretmocerus hayati TaxID=131215 RepID=A0ACC2P8H8_9HYME|nr:hypothetical protein QAD02_015195 [Eretmocerus hayati]
MKSNKFKNKRNVPETSTCKRRRTGLLNLPDAIWNQYQNSLNQEQSVESKQPIQTVTLRCTLYSGSDLNSRVDSVENQVILDESIQEQCQTSVKSDRLSEPELNNTANEMTSELSPKNTMNQVTSASCSKDRVSEVACRNRLLPPRINTRNRLKRDVAVVKAVQKDNSSPPKSSSLIKINSNIMMKKLCVNLVDCQSVQSNCAVLMQRLEELLKDSEGISNQVMDAKQLITNCSIRTVIARKEADEFFKGHLISADAELEQVVQKIELQKSMISDIQKLSNQFVTSVPNLEEENEDASRSASLLKAAQDELSILRLRNDYLENAAIKHRSKLIRLKKIRQKQEVDKKKSVLAMKRKINFLRKKLLLVKSENSCKVEENTELYKDKLENLINMNFTMMKALVDESSFHDNKMNVFIHDRAMKTKDETIEKLKIQVNRLKKQNEVKNDTIKQLMLAKRKNEKDMAIIVRENQVKDEKSKREINRLNSLVNDLNRRRDRWLTDKFHQKCHSMMLLNKLRQLEAQQGKITELNKRQKKMDTSKNLMS